MSHSETSTPVADRAPSYLDAPESPSAWVARLLKGIINPAMIATFVFGLGLVFTPSEPFVLMGSNG